MNEALRQFAMGVAGVRLWYARSPLPGAAPSPDYDFGEPEASEVEAEEVVATPPRPSAPSAPGSEASRQGLARLQGLLAGAEGSSSTNEPQAADAAAGARGPDVVAREAPPVDVPEAADANEAGPAGDPDDALTGIAVSFHWRFWIGERWLLVSSCPEAASRGLEDRLGGNILRALGDTVQSTETLRWPVFSNTAVPGNDAAGARDVIAAMTDTIGRPRQLWLGLEPGQTDEGASKLPKSLVATLGDSTVSFPESLAALSSDPGAKRALWLALQQAGTA